MSRSTVASVVVAVFLVSGLALAAANGINASQVKTAAPVAVTNGASTSEGSSSALARADHTHSTSGMAGVGSCSAGQFATQLNAASGPTCAQPAFSGVSGTVTDAQLASNYSGVGACGAGQFVSTLNDNAAPTCSAPATPTDLACSSGCVSVAEVSATGTASASTFLRGDGTWSTPSGASFNQTVQVNSGAQTQRAKLNFSAAGFTLLGSDNGTDTTTISIRAGGDGSCLTSGTTAKFVAAVNAGAAPTCTAVDATDILSGVFDQGRIPAADVSTRGGIRLNGDLGGTALSPTVVGVTCSTGCVSPSEIAATGTASSSTYLRGDGTWSTPAGGSGNAVEVSITFPDEATGAKSVTVTGQAWVTTSSRIVCTPQATTADGQTVEAYVLAELTTVVGTRVAGTGFDLWVLNPHGASGTFRFNCIGV